MGYPAFRLLMDIGSAPIRVIALSIALVNMASLVTLRDQGCKRIDAFGAVCPN